VVLPINITSDEGVKLAESYFIGNTYPVFVLTSETGEVINRWVGYSNAQNFIRTLKNALADPRTVAERTAQVEKQPNVKDVLFLAGYYAGVRDYLKSVAYYRRAKTAGARMDFSFKIFSSLVNAAWNDVIPIEDVIPVADSILDKQPKNNDNIKNVVRMFGQVTRKKGRTDLLPKYLQAGITATAGSKDPQIQLTHQEFIADYVLYVRVDTTLAIQRMKTGLGGDLKINPKKMYMFARWCHERRINLDEAEIYCRGAAERGESGRLKGMAYHTLAQLYDIRGDTAEAVALMHKAVEAEPASTYYKEELRRFEKKLE